MTDFRNSAVTCIVRPANQTDRWALQKLVLQLIWSEALGFDLRVIGYRTAKIVLLIALIGLEVWLVKRIAIPELQSVVIVVLLFTVLWAIATSLILLLYVVLIPTEPLFNWSMYRVVECNYRPVACAALSYFGNFGVLYHVVVHPHWRRQGLASRLIQYLLKETSAPVYLVCKPRLIAFYGQLGFQVQAWQHLAKPIKTHFQDFALDRRISESHWQIMGFSQDATLPHSPQ